MKHKELLANLTIPLNRVVGDTTKHRKFGTLSDIELVAHPREEVGQAMMSAFDPLGYPSTPTRKRQSGNAIWAKDYVWIGLSLGILGQENIRIINARTPDDGAICVQFQCRYLDANMKFGRNEIPDRRVDDPGTFEYN